jgi:hypothetical protein
VSLGPDCSNPLLILEPNDSIEKKTKSTDFKGKFLPKIQKKGRIWPTFHQMQISKKFFVNATKTTHVVLSHLLKNRKKIIEHHNENNKNHDENRS